MNNESYFHSAPALRFHRTRFNMPFQHSTSFQLGKIVPLMTEQIYPGDTWKTRLSFMLRMFTPSAPLMSNLYQDFYAFYVPWRIIWDHTKQFFGENETGAWTQSLDRVIPQHLLSGQLVKLGTEADYPDGAGTGHTAGTAGWVDTNGNLPLGSIGDYMGIVYRADDAAYEFSVSDMFRRAYLQVYNDWFRDENIIAPSLFSKGDTTSWSDLITAKNAYWNQCFNAAKFHDYFTSLLPEPMKGPTPTIDNLAPVIPGAEHLAAGDKVDEYPIYRSLSSYVVGVPAASSLLGTDSYGHSVYSGSVGDYVTGAIPSNLYAKLNITIEDIRRASVMTHVFENLARFGSRYTEFLQGMWGVTAPDASLQISEYLGGVRFPVKIQEVLSNSDTLSSDQSTGTPVGFTGAMSKSLNGGKLFDKAFTEYGILLVVGVARCEQTYFQGIDRKFTNKSFFDFYLPQAASLGNQPVFTSELNVNANNIDNTLKNKVLGYSEAYAYLRYLPWKLSGIIKPNAYMGLPQWTATDIIPADVSLSQAFIEQGHASLNRALVLDTSVRGVMQFFGDFKFDNDVTRILPAHSQPGLTRI